MRKQDRQAAILELVRSEQVVNQDDLQKRLAENGVSTTLATLSRDLKELHIVKEPTVTGPAVYRVLKQPVPVPMDHFAQQFGEVVVDFTQVEFMNVVKTTPSDGNALAALIDELMESRITGTLAGHDTILIISPSKMAATSLHEMWAAYLN
ncbi:arginine repressor [Furfurilactobacillus sp. WILCCON 0119]|uniref:arginine repressor n=1 Tax=Furfurilactobacillus entadae TaxID=2922307 RepID=UPI0035EA90C4